MTKTLRLSHIAADDSDDDFDENRNSTIAERNDDPSSIDERKDFANVTTDRDRDEAENTIYCHRNCNTIHLK